MSNLKVKRNMTQIVRELFKRPESIYLVCVYLFTELHVAVDYGTCMQLCSVNNDDDIAISTPRYLICVHCCCFFLTFDEFIFIIHLFLMQNKFSYNCTEYNQLLYVCSRVRYSGGKDCYFNLKCERQGFFLSSNNDMEKMNVEIKGLPLDICD